MRPTNFERLILVIAGSAVACVWLLASTACGNEGVDGRTGETSTTGTVSTAAGEQITTTTKTRDPFDPSAQPEIKSVRMPVAGEDLGRINFDEPVCYSGQRTVACADSDGEGIHSSADTPAVKPHALALATLEMRGGMTAAAQFVTFDSQGSGRCWFARPVDKAGSSSEPAVCAARIDCGGVCIKSFFGLSEDPDTHFLAGTLPASATTVTLIQADGGRHSYAADGPLLPAGSGRRIFMVQLPDEQVPQIEVAP